MPADRENQRRSVPECAGVRLEAVRRRSHFRLSLEFPDIESLFKKMGIPPTSKEEDGSDRYTVPAIHDPSTGASIADSVLIAEYLEKTYPDTPKVFPNNTPALQVAFVD